MNSVEESDRCPVCGSVGARVFWEAAGLPVHCHVLCRTQAQALGVERGDIRLAFCARCGLIFNRAFEPARMAYSPEYENALDYSPRFQQYAADLAERLIDRHGLCGRNIIEIACGRGEFLKLLCRQGGNRGVGFDPGAPAESASEAGSGEVRFVRDYYTERYADTPADFVCCRHALEHIPEPVRFLGAVREAIGGRPEVGVFFEVPNVGFTLRQGGIWDVIYEHCMYFSLPSLAACFAEAGFEVREVREAYDGQFLCIEAQASNGSAPSRSGGRRGLEDLARDVADFADRYRRKLGSWQTRLADMAARRTRAVLWGSGSKGVTFLNRVGGKGVVEYVVDINPRKQGMYVAGVGQQIVSPEFLKGYRAEAVVVMNPAYEGEIRSALAGLGLEAEVLVA